MYCEICGRVIEGDPIPIEVDKAVLYVCRGCAARYGKRAPPQTVQKKPPQSQKAKPPSPRLPPVEVELVENYGEVIRVARQNLGLSREALAAMLGVKETVLRRVEAGQLQPDYALAKKLEKALGVKLLVEAKEEASGAKSGGKVERGLTLGEVVEIREDGEK
ncbi:MULTISPECIES: multiprotein bridging factor aMBF1 [Pyrobaculum]|uniref:Transcriptional regulator, XRE family n=2 Tax=Pyrobaculum arsenaticum TaxID=121277 RepID=A4WGY7_PYRAR|nr:multiprotein bridging factor aMBF1 [Pyrobaculum arsenaticum]ABP49654.1 transcriptional regulator, XRE family [Pyrobaculum arsenaticum DSM 13514]MCY0891095.1 multiprotein bridging factor aMBF1 [Pyrobaculum arsenaticum]NYR15640.1 TIGR00270 family protein [Pyrobaculum arsenaticum]